MTTAHAIDRILEYFGSEGKPYPSAVVDEMTTLLSRVTDGERDKIYEHLKETESARFKVSVKELASACQFLGIPYHAVRRFDVVPWSCDACGREFRYFPVAGAEDRLAGIFDFCPRCGFQPGWTRDVLDYAERGTLSPGFEAWYREQRDKAREKYPAGADPYWTPEKERAGEAALQKQRAGRVSSLLAELTERTKFPERRPA